MPVPLCSLAALPVAALLSAAGAAPAADPPLPPGVYARLGRAFASPDGASGVTFSADGRRLAVVSASHARSFEVATGRQEFAVKVQTQNMWDRSPTARFTADGGLTAVWASYPVRLALWRIGPDGAAPDPARYPPDGPEFDSVDKKYAVSGDGTRVVVARPGSLVVLDAATAKPVADWKVPSQDWPALSWDGRAVAVTDSGRVRVLDVATQAELDAWDAPRNRYTTVVFGRKPDLAVVHRFTGQANPSEVSVRDLKARRTTDLPAEVAGPASAVAVSPDGNLVAVVPGWWAEGPVVVYDPAAGDVRHRVGRVRGGSAGFSPDGKTLAVAAGRGVIGLWDVATGELRAGSADPPSEVRRLLYLDGGRTLAGYADGWVGWEVRTGRRSDPLARTAGIGLSPDGRRAAAVAGGRLTVIDGRTGAEVWAADAPPPGTDPATQKPWPDRDYPVRFSADGSAVVVRGGAEVRVWDAATGVERAKVAVGPGRDPVAVSPDGRQVLVGRPVAGRWAPVPAAYDTATGREVWSAEPMVSDYYQATYSPDGRWVAHVCFIHQEGGGGPRGVVVRDAATGRVLWQSAKPEHNAPYAMAFSPAGDLLALGTHLGGVVVYEMTTGQPVWEGKHGATVNAVAFSPDGMTLVAASPDAPVYLWDLYGTRTPPDPAAGTDLRWAVLALGGPDPAAAFTAARALHADPAGAVAAIRAGVKPAVAPDPAAVAGWVADLGSDDFAARDRAEKELTRRATVVAPAVRAALAANPTPEAARRMDRVLTATERPAPDDLAGVRAVGVLARVGTPEAVAALKTFAAGAAGAEPTRAAADALRRLPK